MTVLDMNYGREKSCMHNMTYKYWDSLPELVKLFYVNVIITTIYLRTLYFYLIFLEGTYYVCL